MDKLNNINMIILICQQKLIEFVEVIRSMTAMIKSRFENRLIASLTVNKSEQSARNLLYGIRTNLLECGSISISILRYILDNIRVN